MHCYRLERNGVQCGKLQLKSEWTICPSTVEVVLPLPGLVLPLRLVYIFFISVITSLNSHLAVEPRHRPAVAIVLLHPFLVGFVLELPSLGWQLTTTTTGGRCTSLHDRTYSSGYKKRSHSVSVECKRKCTTDTERTVNECWTLAERTQNGCRTDDKISKKALYVNKGRLAVLVSAGKVYRTWQCCLIWVC